MGTYEEMELSTDSQSEVQSVGERTFGASAKRKKCIAIAVILGAGVVVALVVGLAVGLNQSGDSDGSVQRSRRDKYQPVVLVSLDGFRAGYLSYDVTPHLQRLIGEGVHAPRMLSAYPTLTFPNHYTIATGLYPESHGIIGNKFFDVHFERLYALGSPEARNPRWYGGEPIWLTAKRQGKRSNCYFWVASDVAIDGEYPNEYRKYNGSVPFNERVDTVLDWLTQPADLRPQLVTLYFDEPDHTGHADGPAPGAEMLDTLRMVDGTVGRLVSGLKDAGLYDDVNLIIVSDHGMAERSCGRQVKLNDYLSREEMASLYVYNGAAGRISNKYVYSSRNFTVLDNPKIPTEEILSRTAGHDLHMALYDKAHLPSRLHYAHNDRIDDVIVKMDDQYVFSRYGSSGAGCSGGTHGWDSRYETMSALFVAHGPAFKEGALIPPFENIELYDLMADLLEIQPAPNNGTRGSLYGALKTPPSLDRPGTDKVQCQSATLSAADVNNDCHCGTPLTQLPSRSPLDPHDFLQPVLTAETDPSAVCLSAPDHVTLFSTRLGIPLSTTCTVTKKQDIPGDSVSCVVPDGRLPVAQRNAYTSYSNDTLGLVGTALFSSPSTCGNIARSSAIIPMSKEFKSDLWRELWSMVQTEADPARPAIRLTLGPVFDHDHDGLADHPDDISRRGASSAGGVPVPSHYYAVLARCPHPDQDAKDCVEDLDLISFVLPAEQNKNGLTASRRLLENVARLRDVELLTGLRFLTSLAPAVSARHRTHVPLALWRKPGAWSQDICTAPSASTCSSSYRPVILVSLDGFRADYLVKYNRTPTIEKLIRCGVHAPYMRSAYPTITFPNHYTIATGLYPESHGIIDNNMYDLDIGQKFCLACQAKGDKAWWGGEPIWLTAKKQGKKSATFFWPGSDVPIQGEYPNYYRNYSGSVTFDERVDTALGWLRLPADRRPDFITLYFDEPDHTGHAVGPDSPLIAEKLADVDRHLEQLMEGLYQQDLHACANVIVVADHGMSGISCDRLVSLAADLSGEERKKTYIYDGAVGRISNKYTADGRANNKAVDPPQVSLDTLMERLECSEPHTRVYSKASLQLRHHYTNNERIDDVLIDLDDEWLLSGSGSTYLCNTLGGMHGYDNLYASMHVRA